MKKSTRLFNFFRSRAQGCTCRVTGCGKPLPNVPRKNRNAALLCYEHFLETNKGRDLLARPYLPPVLGGSGLTDAGRLVTHADVHHTASESGNAASIGYYHAVILGWGEIAYNLVICNGNGGGDGEVQLGKVDDAYPYSVGDSSNYTAWAVVVVGNFTPDQGPSPRQWSSLIPLLRNKAGRYTIPRDEVKGHRERRANSACPGFSDALLNQMRADTFTATAQPEEADDMHEEQPNAEQVSEHEWWVAEADTRNVNLDYWLLIQPARALRNTPSKFPFKVGVEIFRDGAAVLWQVIEITGPNDFHSLSLAGVTDARGKRYVGPLNIYTGGGDPENALIVSRRYTLK